MKQITISRKFATMLLSECGCYAAKACECPHHKECLAARILLEGWDADRIATYERQNQETRRAFGLESTT